MSLGVILPFLCMLTRCCSSLGTRLHADKFTLQTDQSAGDNELTDETQVSFQSDASASDEEEPHGYSLPGDVMAHVAAAAAASTIRRPATLTQLSKEVVRLHRTNENLGKDNAELRNKILQMEGHYTHKIQLAAEKIEKLQNEGDALRTGLKSVSDATAVLKSQNTSIYAQFQDMITERQARQKKGDSRFTALEERMRSEMSKMNKSMEDTKQSLNKKIEGLIADIGTVYTRFSHINAHVDRLNQNVHFLATFQSKRPNVPDGVVKFDNVMSQSGYDYNPKTGMFTAPRNGLYAFAVQSFTNGKSNQMWDLQVNGNTILLSRPGTELDRSNSFVLPLKLRFEDKVNVKAENIVTVYGNTYSFFGGWLIKAL